MNLPVFVHVERKALVKSATNRAVVELPPFYKWDHVNLQVTLLTDNPQATAAAPFLIIPTDVIDAVRAAIGNSLTGTARKVLAQQVTFLATPSAFVGTLSLATQEAQDYLAFPEAWRADAAYPKGALVYHKNYTWEALKQAEPGSTVEPGTDATAWALYEIEREPLYFEIEVVQRGNVWKVLHEPCVVAQPVMEEPLVSPDPLEDVDALADALARRLPDTSTIRWTRNQDRYDSAIKAAPDFDPLKGYFYGAVVWDSTTGKYYQSLREQKTPVRAVVESNFDLHDRTLPPADGVALQGGDRVLLMGQTDPGENGIYVVEPGGGWLEGRAVDATQNAHFSPGFSVYVTDGVAAHGMRPGGAHRNGPTGRGGGFAFRVAAGSGAGRKQAPCPTWTTSGCLRKTRGA
jgi:hypothetical protein